MYKALINQNTYLAILEPRHANDLFQIVDKSRDSISQWLNFPQKTNCVEDSALFIEKSLTRLSEHNGYWAGIWYKEELAGSVGYLYIDWKIGKTEIGYWLGDDFKGKGLALQAAKMMINHAFHDLDLNKVEIKVATNNNKSRAIPEKLGFQTEGIIRNDEFLNGVYHDRVIYGLLKEEWISDL
ncbi:ribosomal-protein-serine acetyltransferase [Oceanobacillus limi]|uniref:Ribosomal-protein-serine acetyltransferase n=1 Tax=Oceanobacillus limi TaxID=930131 RepID=A0A1H9YCU5_9BACI|nr:GNAT family protein [Oceanobacillus limi]SES66771.1 ribosomal-protein-serine acetyltransferase [Oceanobacillus limi]